MHWLQVLLKQLYTNLNKKLYYQTTSGRIQIQTHSGETL